jgi:nucleoside-diphosphate-sugar epimerase
VKYLITGGAGYLGHHLCEKLSGHELVVIDKLIYNVKRRWEDNTVFIEDDIKNIKEYEKHFDGVDAVFHLASPRLQDISKTEISDCLEDLKMLCDVSVKNNIRKFIFPSSCSVYGFRDKKVTEEDEVNLTTYYSELKYKSELVLNEYNEISTMLARQATLFGVSKLMRNDLMINNFVKSIKEKKSFEVYGKDTWRPNLYVSDCVDILLQLLDKDFEGIINVGCDELNLTKQDIVDVISKTLNINISEYVSYANNEDTRSYRVDFTKLEKNIDFKFITLSEGIQQLLSYENGVI